MTGIARHLDESTASCQALKAHDIGRAVSAFAQSSFSAARGSARVPDSLDIAPEDLELASRLCPQAKNYLAQLRFGVIPSKDDA